MRRRGFVAGLILVAALAGAQDWKQTGPASVVLEWLNQKSFGGDTRVYGPADLEVPGEVASALDRLGLSRFSVVRNEIWARHGYVFQTEMLAWLFGQVTWYRPNPAIGLGSLGGTAARNINAIKAIEDRWDGDQVARWLADRPYRGDLTTYLTEEEYRIPDEVRMSVNHLGLRPAQVLETEIWARAGWKPADPALARILAACPWYQAKTGDKKSLEAGLSAVERANLALLARREVLDDLEAVTYTLPEGITWVPTLGYGALFVRTLSVGSDTWHYSSTSLWEALAFDPARLPPAGTAPGSELVSPLVKMQIEAEPSPLKKLILYFSNKRYAGVVDTRILPRPDYTPPAYLAAAVRTLGLDWRILLRKEIHARAGAVFSDPKTGPLFRACPWYRARFPLVPTSSTRFGPGVKLTAAERANFALLEGDELADRAQAAQDSGWRVVSDLSGNWQWARITEEAGFRFPVLWGPGEEPPSAADEVRSILAGQGLNTDDFLQGQDEGSVGGC